VSMISWFDRAMFAALLTGAVVATAPIAEAGYTAVKPPSRQSDASHEQILERVYGGDFVADPTGLSFSNASGVTVTRLDDGPAADTQLMEGGGAGDAVAPEDAGSAPAADYDAGAGKDASGGTARSAADLVEQQAVIKNGAVSLRSDDVGKTRFDVRAKRNL